ncbi:SOS response-associated peptidase [Rhodophyticola porphyridii]|nr:SOS response-associated peptidase [Rhodophyticola porphyridii]
MSRRSTPQKKIDERAFPVRVRFAVPERGLGARMDDLHRWLAAEVGSGEYAVHSSSALAMDATGVYLRDVAGAQALLQAFPDLMLADCLDRGIYTSPAHSAAWSGLDIFSVCNLYSMTKGQDAIREIAKAWDDRTGNMPPLSGIFPDYAAPVVWNGEAGRVLSMMRWGMPSPAFALKNKKTDPGVTNVRNTKSPHWRRWLGVQHRCVVPFTSFSEYEKQPGQSPTPVWFALGDDRPLAFFAGIWTSWTSVRKLKEGETTNDLFGFLTTDANREVGAIHPKAMPVILQTAEEIDRWLTAPTEDALEMQRPLPDDSLQLVAKGNREDVA